MNSKFVDYDFTKDPKYSAGYNGPGDMNKCAALEDVTDVIPESQWRELADNIQKSGGGCSQYVTRIFDQKQEGSCVANASSQAVEIMQAQQFGKDRVVHLSAISLYKRIGSSAQSGAVVTDAIEELAENGVLPLDSEENKKRFKHTMPNTGFKTPYPDGWKDTAAMFKATEWTMVNSKAELMTALLKQWPLVVGRSGHSILYAEVFWKDGGWVVKYPNSWHESWGDHGYGYDTERTISSAAHGAFALRQIVAPTFQA